MRNKREKRGLLMLVLLLFGSFLALTAQAQTGVICGTVTDAKFKEPLIGATVSIEGTTMGAITDMDGNFRLENIQPGKYALIASYVSYQAKTIKDISVVARQETVVRIELSEADLQLEGVTVARIWRARMSCCSNGKRLLSRSRIWGPRR